MLASLSLSMSSPPSPPLEVREDDISVLFFLLYTKLKEREKTKREGKKCLRAKRDYSYGEVTEKERKREK